MSRKKNIDIYIVKDGDEPVRAFLSERGALEYSEDNLGEIEVGFSIRRRKLTVQKIKDQNMRYLWF